MLPYYYIDTYVHIRTRIYTKLQLILSPEVKSIARPSLGRDCSLHLRINMAFLLSGHLVLISLIFLPVVPCSYGPDLATWMQDGESGVFLEDHSYTTIWSTVGRSPLSRMWLCLGRKSRNFKCHKTRRHTSMMILLLMLSGDVEINPGPVTGRNQQVRMLVVDENACIKSSQ